MAGTGVVPVRKAGKLPRVAASRSYELEYGTATLELPADTVAAGARVFVVDDVLATGGTAAATCDLLADVGAEVVGRRRAAGAGRARRTRAAEAVTGARGARHLKPPRGPGPAACGLSSEVELPTA